MTRMYKYTALLSQEQHPTSNSSASMPRETSRSPLSDVSWGRDHVTALLPVVAVR